MLWEEYQVNFNEDNLNEEFEMLEQAIFYMRWEPTQNILLGSHVQGNFLIFYIQCLESLHFAS